MIATPPPTIRSRLAIAASLTLSGVLLAAAVIFAPLI